MTYEINIEVELLVTRIEIETHAYSYEDTSRDGLSLSMEVIAEVTHENHRKVGGEVHLIAEMDSEYDPTRKAYRGTWTFYTSERFYAEIVVPVIIIERIWLVAASMPEWFRFCIAEGPPVTQLDRTADGEFRIRFRAGKEGRLGA